MACKCHNCGKLYKMDLIIPDELWDKITPSKYNKKAGLLCPTCIINRIERLVGYSAFKLIDCN